MTSVLIRRPARIAAAENSPVAGTVRGYMIASLGLLAGDGLPPTTIYAREALYAQVTFSERLAEEVSAIWRIDRGVSDRSALES
ncbi:MAG: hypothetical protein WD738_13410 [Pirellulales bacterium]